MLQTLQIHFVLKETIFVQDNFFFVNDNKNEFLQWRVVCEENWEFAYRRYLEIYIIM